MRNFDLTLISTIVSLSRYEVKNKQVEFSIPCGPALSQLRGIDLFVNKLNRKDHPDNELIEVDIKAEKFIVSYVQYICVHSSNLDPCVRIIRMCEFNA